MKDGALPLVLVGAVLAGLLTLPRWADEVPASRKLEARLEAVEKELQASKDRIKELDARLVHVADAQGDHAEQLRALRPGATRTLRLEPGGTEKWTLDPGGAAYVQFLRLDEQGRPVLTVDNKGGRVEAAFVPGAGLVAVDDLGRERRIYTTTLHRLVLDRTGRPAEAEVSVQVTVETD